MSRSRPSTFLALKLVALAAICSVGLIALPAVASAAAPTCQVLDGSGASLVDDTISVTPSSSTNLRLTCAGDTAITHYEIDNTGSSGSFNDGVTSGPHTDVLDASNHGEQMWGAYVAPSTTGGDTFAFVGYDTGGTASAPVFVSVLVALPAPVCTITSGDTQNVAKNATAEPVPFTCTDNGDGPITTDVSGGSLGTATLDQNGSSVDYVAGQNAHGTDTDVELTAHTANSAWSTLVFTYQVTNTAPDCQAISTPLQGGYAEQTTVDFSTACSDPNGDPISYTVTDPSGASGNLDDEGLYDEADSQIEDTTPFTDTFGVTADDGDGGTTVFNVNVVVTPNHPPTCIVNAGDDHQTVLHGGNAITIPIHCSDQDAGTNSNSNNNDFNVSLDDDALATQGTAQLNDAGDTLTYTPYWSGLGSDTIALVVTQNNDPDQHSTVLVHLNVTDPSAPACADLSLATTNTSSASTDLACTDADGDFVDYYVDQAPLNGTIDQGGQDSQSSGSDSSITYIPNPGFVGTDTFTVIADDGARQTPITVTAHVSATPVAPLTPVVTPPTVTPPVVVVQPPAPKLSSPITVKDGKLSLELGCTNKTTSCKASVALTTKLGGKTVSLGSKAITIKPGKKGAIKISLSRNAKKTLRAFAGKTITVKVAVKTTNPKTHGTVTVTKALKVKVPR